MTLWLTLFLAHVRTACFPVVFWPHMLFSHSIHAMSGVGWSMPASFCFAPPNCAVAGKLAFDQAVWVEDLVAGGMALQDPARFTLPDDSDDSEASSDDDDRHRYGYSQNASGRHAHGSTSAGGDGNNKDMGDGSSYNWDTLPQGYRTADRVAVYRVPVLPGSSSIMSVSSLSSIDWAPHAELVSATGASDQGPPGHHAVDASGHRSAPGHGQEVSPQHQQKWVIPLAEQQSTDRRHGSDNAHIAPRRTRSTSGAAVRGDERPATSSRLVVCKVSSPFPP
jgi:hypothetical protein